MSLADAACGAAGEWTVHCDGSAQPNPGRMGLGVVIVAPDGRRDTLCIATHATGCNNEAELRAVGAALDALRRRGARAVRVYTDSSLLVAQLGDRPVAPVVRLAALYDEARDSLRSFERAALHWIPRHRNGEADALARAALGIPPKPPAKSAGRRRR